MKKLLYSAVALATLLTAACQQENLEPVSVGDNTVTYTVQVPQNMQTKAIGDGLDCDYTLTYEVYREAHIDDLNAEPFYFGTETFDDGVAEVTLQFVKDQKYVVLFWAQNERNTLFDYSDLRQVTIANTNAANDKNTAVFAGMDTVNDCVSAAKGNVELVRPVSQINIATSNSSLVLPGENNKITPTKSWVTVNGLFPVYNVYNQTASNFPEAEDLATTTYTEAAVPTDDFGSVNGIAYTYVAMNYVGFAPATGTTVDVDFTFITNEGKIDHSVPNVPIKPNYRTNILGNLISEEHAYTVTLDKTWGDEDIYIEPSTVSNATDLQAAINEIPADMTGNITLVGNIDLSELSALVKSTAKAQQLVIEAGKDIVLDLNGYSISATDDTEKNYSVIDNRGTLSIINSNAEAISKITTKAKVNSGWNRYSAVLANNPGGNLTVGSGIVIEHQGGTDMAYGIDNLTNGKGTSAVVTVDGATVTSPYRAIRQFLNGVEATNELYVKNGSIIEGANKSVWMQDPSKNANSGKLVIEEGAKLYGDAYLSVTDGSTEWPVSVSIASAALQGESTVLSANVPAGYAVLENAGIWSVEFIAVAKIGALPYETLAAAIAAVQEGETITILAGKTLAEGTIKLPATLKNVTILGEEGVTLQDMTISAADGNSYSYEGLTFDGLTFNNSRIILTGWRNGEEVIKNLTVTNCKFINLDDSTNSAPVHINKDASEAVNGFTFTNNVIDGATGGSKSGIYAQLTGEVLVSGNIINNVSFRPYVIQITNNDGIADNFVVTNNTFSGSSVGRAQGLGSNAAGTDEVTIVVSENIFKGITESQQICYWNFNAEETTADLSHNYYDINIVENPGKIYYNNAAADENALFEMGVFPIYTALNADGTINRNETYSPPTVQIGSAKFGTFEEAISAAKEGDTIELLYDVTLSEDLEIPAGVTLNGNGKQINGSIYAGGDLTFAGHTKVTGFSASYYDRTITIEEGACLEVTGTGRVSLAYRNTFDIKGNIENAKEVDKANLQPSLIIPGGISITGGNNATMNIKDAYVKIGSTSSKNSAANGTFTLNIENSVAEFTNQLTFAEPTSGKNPTFNLNIKNSVLTTATKLCVAAPNTKVVIDNSNVTLGSYIRNSGEIELKNGSVLTGATIQFGENGGNNGTIKVDNSTLTVTATSTGQAFDGKGVGSVEATNNATVSIEYYKAMTITADATSTFTGTEVK